MTSPQMRRLCKMLAKDAPPARVSWVHYIINARARRHAAAAKAITNCAPGQSSEVWIYGCTITTPNETIRTKCVAAERRSRP